MRSPRPRHVPALGPATFDTRLSRGRAAPGELGQFVNYASFFKNVGSSRFTDRLGWPVDHLGTPVLDWADGDGITPFVGPTLTAAGAPGAGVATPWTGRDGEDVTATSFDGVADRYWSAAAFDPGSGQDVRILALFRVVDDGGAVTRVIIKNNDAGDGFSLSHIPSTHRISTTINDDLDKNSEFVIVGPGWILADVYWDLDGNHTLKVNGSTSSGAAPGGDHGAGDGLGIGGEPGGAQECFGDIARVMVWFGGSELSNASDHSRLLAHIFGIQNAQGNGTPTFTRASSAVQPVGTRHHVIASGAPRGGSADGLLVEPAGVNKVYNTINPQVTNGWTATGGVLSVVDDSAALLAAGLREAGPNALQLANASGLTQYVYGGDQCGNVNAHSLSVFGRLTAGAGVNVGLRRNVGGAFAGVAMTDGYATRSLDQNRTPANADCQFALQIPDGVTVLFIIPQCEEALYCTSPIPNVAAAATATRVIDDLVSTYDPVDGEGSLEFDVTPLGWSAAETGGANLLFLTGGGVGVVYVSGAGFWEMQLDGTATITTAVAPADGVAQHIRIRWHSDQSSIEVDGVRTNGAYDGTLAAAGTWELAPGASMLIESLRAYRDGSG